ncbi:MAG: DEAD/DEAH box helicase [Ignavibacteriae bacterium]|nr:DEAD/DEAH box helicase [Ignavibacteriota bacterium]
METVDEFFLARGPLSRRAGFEFRPQQGKMAVAIAQALEHREHLIVEAPTGVGKTIAYLVPAILHATRYERKAIVSTHTKNLQEQIGQKDIPILREILKVNFGGVVLKGRKNYLCTTRLRQALASSGSLFNAQEQKELQRIHDWSLQTHDGDMENLGFAPDAAIWEMVCSEKGICSSTSCKPDCFFQRAKARVRGAQLVVMNHALFFTLMALQGGEDRFIFENDFVIFDEAHTLESVAGTGAGKRLSRYQVLSSIHRLYNPKTKKGLLAKQKKEVKALCEDVEKAALEFFDTIRQASIETQNSASREVRIRVPYVVDNSIAPPLVELQAEVHKIEESLKNENVKKELAAAREYLWEAQILASEFLEQPEPGFTYWVELAGSSTANTTLCASPSSIADTVGPTLFRENTSVIMTSATLAVDNNLGYYQERIGAMNVRGLILDSPFDYRRQMKLCLAKGIPEPDTDEYASHLPAWIMQAVLRSQGKALVLFTSALLMRAVAATLADEFDQRNITLLVQGAERQRHELLENFKRDIHSVLFGLDSFWMGIDVPGEALEHVVITRLPFAVPNHPLIEARLESIANRGGNAFMEYTLPEAVLKLRQGVGRLLRSCNDTGLVTILDSRILTRRYGRVFISSLPECRVEIINGEGEVEYLPTDDW